MPNNSDNIGMGDITSAFAKLNESMSLFADHFRDFGDAMARSLTVPIQFVGPLASAAEAAAEAASDFEQQQVELQQLQYAVSENHLHEWIEVTSHNDPCRKLMCSCGDTLDVPFGHAKQPDPPKEAEIVSATQRQIVLSD